jgi:lysyl-tRNA synthetase class 1
LTEREQAILDERVAAARAWLEAYAPDTARVAVKRDGLPAATADLDDTQRRFLAALSSAAEGETPAGGDAWQALIFNLAKKDDLPARRAFEAIYAAFLGRPNGPRAGWLLASLEPPFVIERARAAAATPPGAAS